MGPARRLNRPRAVLDASWCPIRDAGRTVTTSLHALDHLLTAIADRSLFGLARGHAARHEGDRASRCVPATLPGWRVAIAR